MVKATIVALLYCDKILRHDRISFAYTKVEEILLHPHMIRVVA